MNQKGLRFFPVVLSAGLLFISCNARNDFPVITTVAGTGIMGTGNGPGSSASFSNPMGITQDGKGNIYLADSRNNLIRKITSEGIVTTFAGTGAAGSADGKADTASFFFPTGITADDKGNVYVADTHNSLIRKISADGFVTTLAGSRIYNTVPGTDSILRFDHPAGITTDAAGYIYVADTYNNLIRKISPSGKIVTIAGNGSRGSKDGMGVYASFYLPGGIAMDSAGDIYISDTYNNLIRKISPDGLVTTIAGNGTRGSLNGTAKQASFLHPAGLALDPLGNIYVADVGNNKIRMITPDGRVTTYAGSGFAGAVNGRDSISSFHRPYGVTADKKGTLYIADYLSNMVRQIKR